MPWAAHPQLVGESGRAPLLCNKQTNMLWFVQWSDSIMQRFFLSRTGRTNRLPPDHLCFLLVCLTAGALSCVVYRDCTTRLLTAGRVATLEQHSHRCSVATSTLLFYLSEAVVTCHTQVSIAFLSTFAHSSAESTNTKAASRRIHTSHSTRFRRWTRCV
jgi:hypothetical protein